MPLYDYVCKLCDFRESYIDKIDEFAVHYCPNCFEDCKRWVRIDPTTGVVSRKSQPTESEYDPFKGKTQSGVTVLMTREISAPAVHQRGYSITDARYTRGRGK